MSKFIHNGVTFSGQNPDDLLQITFREGLTLPGQNVQVTADDFNTQITLQVTKLQIDLEALKAQIPSDLEEADIPKDLQAEISSLETKISNLEAQEITDDEIANATFEDQAKADRLQALEVDTLERNATRVLVHSLFEPDLDLADEPKTVSELWGHFKAMGRIVKGLSKRVGINRYLALAASTGQELQGEQLAAAQQVLFVLSQNEKMMIQNSEYGWDVEMLRMLREENETSVILRKKHLQNAFLPDDIPSKSILEESGISTLGELPENLTSISGIGESKADELRVWLQNEGLIMSNIWDQFIT